MQKLDQLEAEAAGQILKGETEADLYQIKIKYLGKKGLLTDVLKELGGLSNEDRPQVGARANQLKAVLEGSYASRLDELKREALAKSLSAEAIDITLPGISLPRGSIHPIAQVLSQMKDIFRRMGFDFYEGPEMETDYYNFEALNIPKDHPARDMQDTFYLDGDRLLRTHTSPVQIRVMEKTKPPIRMVAPGAVYRRDSDVSHSPMFHQIEGLVVDEGISLGHLKGILESFLGEIFHSGIKMKFRPSFFPFTEPSAEVDIECVICAGKGCRVCKQTGWLEIMGCGMVDPAVFKFVGIDPEKYTGLAFGIGIERVAMLKYGINDIRLFFENDRRFLEQF
ncbi:MAG: phenylalanine--tRNA ligase subunit alpha [Deltaproteobacteria bacterium]|nr:phenylalanine--tRNA ligase subunit alpha [Deltaproteobacteria bacterium]